MKLKLSAAMVTMALLTACGGGGGDDTLVVGETPTQEVSPIESPDRDNSPSIVVLSEDRTRPAGGTMSSNDFEVKSNGAPLFMDTGPQRVNGDRVASWPGLRYGNFLVSNNPWNGSAALYPSWYQEISLFDTGDGQGVKFDWDWGAEGDTAGSTFNTKSYPEVIYGTKSAAERSGSFAETGLPVEIADAPYFTIDYDFSYEARRSASPTASGSDSEFNIAIESFYHSSCDVRRTGNLDTDNTVFETMVWLKMGDRKPSGEAPRGTVATSDGRLYDVYTKLSSNIEYIAFVAQQEEMSGTVLYSELLDHAQDNAATYGIYALQDSDCLANILVGTEIWHGAGTFNLNNLQINRSYD